MTQPKHKARPHIVWDERDSDGFGGFRVIKHIENFQPPGDWVADAEDPTHFLPTFKPCKYRRLSKAIAPGKPIVKIHCLLFEEVVDHPTCVDCDQCVAPTPKLLDVGTNIERPEPQPGEYDEPLDAVFDPEQPDSKYVNRRSQDETPPESKQKRSQWAPCDHRKASTAKSGCSSCQKKLICTCSDCPLVGTTVTKKDCSACQHRKTT